MGGANVINAHYKYHHQDLRGFLDMNGSGGLCHRQIIYLAGHLFSLQGAKISVGLVLASQRSSVTVLLVILSTHWVTTMTRPPPQDTEHLKDGQCYIIQNAVKASKQSEGCQKEARLNFIDCFPSP